MPDTIPGLTDYITPAFLVFETRNGLKSISTLVTREERFRRLAVELLPSGQHLKAFLRLTLTKLPHIYKGSQLVRSRSGRPFLPTVNCQMTHPE